METKCEPERPDVRKSDRGWRAPDDFPPRRNAAQAREEGIAFLPRVGWRPRRRCDRTHADAHSERRNLTRSEAPARLARTRWIRPIGAARCETNSGQDRRGWSRRAIAPGACNGSAYD